ncbi:MAG: FHA domain-containing protein [Anaerolineales bacterium]|nr:FHA domain-containing protein [Anaerolineales bacterium]
MTAQELARLIVEQGPTPGAEFTLSGAEMRLGRELDCDINLISEQVSRHHAVIKQVPEGYQLTDLNSRNGTYVNTKRLTAPRLLRDGDEVRLGQFVALRFVAPAVGTETIIAPPPVVAAPPPTLVAAAPPPAADSTLVAKRPTAPMPIPPVEPAPPPRLTITVGGAPTHYALTAAEYSLGRADDNDIVVAGSFVSRKHLRLVRTPAGYEVHVAPTATNPVLRGGQPLTGAVLLNDGDELSISPAAADTAVIMRYAAAGAPATPAPPVVNAGPATRPMPRPTLEPAGSPPTARLETPGMATIIGQVPVLPTVSGQLVVTLPGRAPSVHTLSDRDVRLGRATDNDIVIADEFVSRYQARLRWTGDGFELIPNAESTNSFQLDGKPVTGPTRLAHGARLRIGGSQPGERVALTYLASDDGQDPSRRKIDFSQKTRLTIGRDASNDIVLDAPIISRYHALVEKVGQRVRVQDLRSANGTFVNGQAIEGEVWLKPQDVIRIGPNRFVMGQDQLAQYDESDGVRVEVVGLNKRVRKDLNLLQDISLVFQKREFVVVVGQSGGGKSTLVDAISGYRPATQGQVFVNDVEVYKHFDIIRHNIGFVPQKDIIHMDLSVYEALDYAARLRMPSDTTRQERHQRVMEVLTDLDLAHRKDLKIAGLSGGQQKRVSIGVELLTKPGLFFLDEPTSGLDPGTETALMQLMRKLADQGRTIILITHATKNVMLADKVVFLARGGHLAWFGPPNEALAYFDQYRTERDQRAGPMEFDQIYNLLDDPANGSPADWGERYRRHNAYQEFVVEPLQERTPLAAQQLTESAAKRRRGQVSGLRQFFILSARNVRILLRDRASLLLMLLTAPAIGLLDVVLAAGQGRNPFSFANGDLNSVIVSLIVLINNGVMVGGLSQMRELVKERDIYKRERMVNLGLLPYILSKVWVAIVLAVYAATFFVIIRNLSFDMPGGWTEVGLMYLTLILLVVAGSMLGLFASALAPNANAAPLVLILFLVPQIVLSGALVPLPQAQTVIASSRWAFQAIMAITGAGSDVAADSCWKLPAAEYDDLTDEDFEARGCNCSGVSALRQASCDFPGLGEYYDEAIDKPDPVEPAALRDEPADLQLPPEPKAPENMQDPVAVNDYLTALQDYLAEVNIRREAFEADMDAYREEADAYQDAMKEYQEEKTDLEVARATAKGSAKARIRLFYDDFGWTFVDKSSPAYGRTLLTVWGAQLAIIFILFITTIFLQRRWDVA